MKLLTITIPCYNSAAYMRKAIESLLPGGDDVEILVVNDGSTKDNTLEIAREYEEKYPGIVRAIDQPNKGHGGAVNTGIQNATGLFFKVVDSDDWVKKSAYAKILGKLKEIVMCGEKLDLLISNYVYEKDGEKKKKVIHFRRMFPQDEIFTWSDCHHFSKGHYILMHSAIYRTQILRDSGMVLPEHTFYVDNIYVYEPLLHVEKMCYLDVNFYRYYIGRDDQSVNEEIMISRIDQQLRVNYLMVDYLVDNKSKAQKDKKRYKYMRNYLEIITTISSILLIKKNTEDSLQEKRKLWTYIKGRDRHLWAYLRGGLPGNAMNLPGRGGRKVSVECYKIAQKIFKFN
ncbi:MAG: glycosyltransferase family 2 protein [Lachnospiraceae bacterium]|nr:glycosyltransferase family 2 protein [Lachnospiraceae bacterium]